MKDIYDGFWDGPHATPKPSDDGPIFLGIKNITEDGHLDLSEIRHIAEKDFQKWIKRVEPKFGDIVFSYEATLNRYAIIPENFRGCLGRRLALIRPNIEIVDTRFLYYYFFGRQWRETIVQHIISGATVDRIPIIEFSYFEVYLPSLPTQRKISAVLSAYDELIEINTRRIHILEQMAQTIYNKWFSKVNARGENASLPEGWEMKTLDYVLSEIESGSRPKGGIDPNQRGVPSVGAENIIGLGKYNYSSEKYVSADFYNAMTRGHIKNKDVLIYKDGASIGRKSMFRDGFPHNECCINEHVFILRTNEKCTQNFLYFWLDLPDMTQNIKNLNANAAQPGINQAGVKGLPILLPDEIMLKKLDDVIDPMMGLLFNLAKKNANLRRTRDLLLPRLVSGEVGVEGL